MPGRLRQAHVKRLKSGKICICLACDPDDHNILAKAPCIVSQRSGKRTFPAITASLAILRPVPLRGLANTVPACGFQEFEYLRCLVIPGKGGTGDSSLSLNTPSALKSAR